MSRRGTSGVTQLELLVSLVIMAMIAVLLANALDFKRQSLSRTSLISADTEKIVLRHRLRTWIEGMPLDYSGQTAKAFFEGDEQELRFRTMVRDGSFLAAATTEFTVGLRMQDGTNSFAVRSVGQHPVDRSPQRFEQVFADDIDDLTIRYFGRISTETEPRWHRTWSDPVFLPVLVKIEWEAGTPAPPLTLRPGKTERQSEMSLSSLVPPG